MKIRSIRCLSLAWMIILLVAAGQGLRAQTKRIGPASERSVFRCKLLIDPGSGKTIADAFIETNNGRIIRVGAWARWRRDPDVKLIDVRDKYIIPGLIDTHGHFFGGLTMRHTTADMIPAFYLACGVTTVRSPGSMEPEGDMGLRNRIDSGRFLGPRVFLSGPYIEQDPVTVGWMNPVRTPEEVRLKVEQWVGRGATSVKVYARMSGDVLRSAVEAGHAHGVKVLAHLGAVTWREAIRLGVDEIFHGVLAMPDIRPPGVRDKPQSADDSWIGAVNLAASEVPAILREAAEARVVLTPTAVVVEPLEPLRNHMDEQKPYFTPEAWTIIEGRLKKPLIPNGEKVLAKNKEFIRMASEAGCILTTGTDQVGFTLLPGYSLWREMEIFAEAGLRPMDILRAATANGALALGRGDLLGSLEAGRLADFVILDGNPLEGIRNVREVAKVVKGGVVYEPAAILKPLAGKYH